MLVEGVAVHALEPHPDARGVFTEVFRSSWDLQVTPAQWNVVHSEPNVLRGVHAHWRHTDYLTVVAGRASIGLYDLRAGSRTEGVGAIVELAASVPTAIVIPTGVAHGFYFHEHSIHVYAVSHEWDPADELGCRWDDPALGIEWPSADPHISPRDANLGPLSSLRDAWRTAPATAGS